MVTEAFSKTKCAQLCPTPKTYPKQNVHKGGLVMGRACQAESEVPTEACRVWLRYSGPWNALVVRTRELKVRLARKAAEATTFTQMSKAIHILSVQVATQQACSLAPQSAVETKVNMHSEDMVGLHQLANRRQKPTLGCEGVLKDPWNLLSI